MSTGVPGRVQLAGSTQAELGEAFDLEPRGPIEVKGVGVVEPYLVVGRR